MWQLDDALCERSRELEAVDDQKPLTSLKKRQIVCLFKKAVDHLEGVCKRKNARPEEVIKSAKGLQKVAMAFSKQCENYSASCDADLLLMMVLHELVDDIEHYVYQIFIVNSTVNIEPVPTEPGSSRPLMANRPTNVGAKERYAELVEQYQSAHGTGSFPKPSAIKAQLKAEGHIVADRTLRGWKSQLRFILNAKPAITP